jgi:hypothetical protein
MVSAEGPPLSAATTTFPHLFSPIQIGPKRDDASVVGKSGTI